MTKEAEGLEFWRGLAEDVRAWSERNFPRSVGRPEDPLAGIVEELGELVDAIAARDRDAAVDAISDAVIYLADFCGKQGLDLGNIVARAQSTEELDGVDEKDERAATTQLLSAVGRVHYHFLKARQGIRGNEDHAGEMRRGLAKLVAILWDLHDETRTDRELAFDASVRLTWEEVRKRDWRRDPTSGGTK